MGMDIWVSMEAMVGLAWRWAAHGNGHGDKCEFRQWHEYGSGPVQAPGH